jgi:Domain of unknown function (DUF927)
VKSERPKLREKHGAELLRPGERPKERGAGPVEVDGLSTVVLDDDDDDDEGDETGAEEVSATPDTTVRRDNLSPGDVDATTSGNGEDTGAAGTGADTKPADVATLWREAVVRLAAMGDEREVHLKAEAKRLKVRPGKLDKAVLKLLAEQAVQAAAAEAERKLTEDPDFDASDEQVETIDDAIQLLAGLSGAPYLTALSDAARKYKLTRPAIERLVQQKREQREPRFPPADVANGVALPRNYRLDETGLWFTPLPSERNPEPRPVFVCGPFKVLGQARDLESRAWGVAIEWLDHDRRRHIWSCPQRLVHQEGNAIAAELADAGLACGSSKQAHELLKQFLGSLRTSERLQSAEHGGWHVTSQSAGIVDPDITIIAPE